MLFLLVHIVGVPEIKHKVSEETVLHILVY